MLAGADPEGAPAVPTLSEDDMTSVAIDEMSMALDMATGGGATDGSATNVIRETCVAKYLLSGSAEDLAGGEIELCDETVRANSETIKALERLAVPVITTSGPVSIPIATVDDDARELVFGRAGVPLCDRGEDCMAHMIPGHPTGPLHAYRGPGHDPSQNTCLLCIRHNIAMIKLLHRSGKTKMPLGIVPPFANPVDAPGGYRSAFCAIKPCDTDVISGGIHICGAGVGMKKMYNPYSQKWYIDQSVAIFGAGGNFFF